MVTEDPWSSSGQSLLNLYSRPLSLGGRGDGLGENVRYDTDMIRLILTTNTAVDLFAVTYP